MWNVVPTFHRALCCRGRELRGGDPKVPAYCGAPAGANPRPAWVGPAQTPRRCTNPGSIHGPACSFPGWIWAACTCMHRIVPGGPEPGDSSRHPLSMPRLFGPSSHRLSETGSDLNEKLIGCGRLRLFGGYSPEPPILDGAAYLKPGSRLEVPKAAMSGSAAMPAATSATEDTTAVTPERAPSTGAGRAGASPKKTGASTRR